MLLNNLQLDGLLSFAPGSPAVELTPLNVLIGPNGVGKTNFIEAVELLHAAPTDLRNAIRLGGRPADWFWHGNDPGTGAQIQADLGASDDVPVLRYAIRFGDNAGSMIISGETLGIGGSDCNEETAAGSLYCFRGGRAQIRMVAGGDGNAIRQDRELKRETLDIRQSVLSQQQDLELYPELTLTGRRFRAIQIFREWSFGRSSSLRSPQPSNLPTDSVLPQLGNLALVLNDLEHRPVWPRFNELMRRFLPRFSRLTTKVSGGSVQVYLHEEGLSLPVPATRLSDGTLRFLALLSILLNAESASLICIEEPELGLHPDAMALLAELLLEASSKTQIIVTTHSDALVSDLTPRAESVLVCEYGSLGTELHRLDSDRLRFWLDKYRLGEIWRLGKLGGNP